MLAALPPAILLGVYESPAAAADGTVAALGAARPGRRLRGLLPQQGGVAAQFTGAAPLRVRAGPLQMKAAIAHAREGCR